MRRIVAINRLKKIISRLNDCNGVIETPDCNYAATRIKSAYIFGSVLKGSQTPNDIDIIVEFESVGNFRSVKEIGIFDNRKYRSYGVMVAKRSCENAIISLRKHIPMVRIHDMKIDGDIAYPRVMIFPSNHFDFDEQEKENMSCAIMKSMQVST